MQTSLIGVKLDNTGALEQTSQSLEFAATTTVTINISVVGQNSAPINLAGSALILTVKSSTFYNAQTVISIQATIDNAASGTAHFPIPNTVFATARGAYVYDVTLIDSSGNTDQIVPIGSLYITDSSYAPGQSITPLVSQLPLAQGPAGPAGATGPAGPAGPGALIASIATGPAATEVGSTIVNPQFTVTNSETPNSASFQDSTDTQTITPPSLTSLGYGGVANTFPARSYTKSTLNATETWTYSMTIGSTTITNNWIAEWQAKAYYGMSKASDALTPYDTAFITGLSTSRLQASSTQSYSFVADDGTSTGLGTSGTLLNGATPDNISTGPINSDFELGFKFTVDGDGYITALKFYKDPTDTHTSHTLHLWNADTQAQILSVVSSGETGSGWQTVPITATLVHSGTNYIASMTVLADTSSPFFGPPNGPNFQYPKVSGHITAVTRVAISPPAFPTQGLTQYFQGPDIVFAPVLNVPKFAHMALPASWGDPTNFVAGGDPVAWTKVASSIDVVNAFGVHILYNLWRSPQGNDQPFVFTVTQ